MVISALAGMGGADKSALVLAADAITHHERWFCAELFVNLHSYAPGPESLSAETVLDVILGQLQLDPQDISLRGRRNEPPPTVPRSRH